MLRYLFCIVLVITSEVFAREKKLVSEVLAREKKFRDVSLDLHNEYRALHRSRPLQPSEEVS